MIQILFTIAFQYNYQNKQTKLYRRSCCTLVKVMDSVSFSSSQKSSQLQNLQLDSFQLGLKLPLHQISMQKVQSLQKIQNELAVYIASFQKQINSQFWLKDAYQDSCEKPNVSKITCLIRQFKSIQSFLAMHVSQTKKLRETVSVGLQACSLSNSHLIPIQSSQSYQKSKQSSQSPEQSIKQISKSNQDISQQNFQLEYHQKNQRMAQLEKPNQNVIKLSNNANEDSVEFLSNQNDGQQIQTQMKQKVFKDHNLNISMGRGNNYVGNLVDVNISAILMQQESLKQQVSVQNQSFLPKHQENLRFFDKFQNLSAKTTFFILLCNAIQYKGTKQRKRRLSAILKFVTDRNLTNEMFGNIRCSTVKTLMETIFTRLFLMCLYNPKPVQSEDTNKKQLGYQVQDIFQQLNQYVKTDKVEDFIVKNRDKFCFDSNLQPEQNFFIFKFTVYFIAKINGPEQLQTFIGSILKTKNDTLIDSYLKDQTEIDEKFFFSFTQEQSTIISDDSIFQKYQNLPQIGDYFYMKNDKVGFDTSNLRRGLEFQSFQLDKFLEYKQIDRLDIFACPCIPVGNQGLTKICHNKRWKLRQLHVWNCNITSLVGSGLCELTELELLSLSNNPLRSDSVKYLLAHKWTKVTDLRLTFEDGSESWDLLQPKISMPFPNLSFLYLRECKNLKQHTLQQLILLRDRGITCYFRIKKQHIHLLDNIDFRSFDVDNEIDKVEFFQRVYEKSIYKIVKKLKNTELDEKKLIDLVKEEINNMRRNVNTKTIHMM